MALDFSQFGTLEEEIPDFSAFGTRVDEPKAASRERTWGEALKDSLLGLGRGAGAVVEGAGSLYGLATGDMDNPVRQAGQDASDFYKKRQSPGLKTREAARATEIKGADGEVEKFGTAIKETVTDPALLSSFLTEQIPQFIGPAGIGRVVGWGAKALGVGGATAGTAATTGAVATGAAMQGSSVGGDTFDDLMDPKKVAEATWQENDVYVELMRVGVPQDEAKKQVALILARQSAAKAGAISAAAQALPGGSTIERVIAGAGARPGGRVLGVAKGALGEAASESVEEGFGKVAGNLAVREVDPTRDVLEGSGEAAGMGFVGGKLMGGIVGGIEKPTGSSDPIDAAASIMQAGSVDEAIDAAERALDTAHTAKIPSEAERAEDRRYNVEFESVPLPATETPAPQTQVGNEIDFDRPGALGLIDQARGVPRARDELAAELQRDAPPAEPPAIAIPGAPAAPQSIPPITETRDLYTEAVLKSQRGELLTAYERTLLDNPPASPEIAVVEGHTKVARDPAQMTMASLVMAAKLTRSDTRRAELSAEIERRAQPQESENARPVESEARPDAGAAPGANAETAVDGGVPVPTGGATESAAGAAPQSKAEVPAPETVTPAAASAVEKPEVTEPNDYASSQVKMPEDVTERALTAAKTLIAPEDVAEKGLEDRPHITVKYGLHTDNAEDLRKTLAGEGAGRATFGPIKIFRPEGKEYDVVVQSVESPDLHRLNAKVGDNLENTETHPEYRPHMTLGYVKRGTGAKYERAKSGLEGTAVDFDQVEFSSRDETVTPVKLGAAPNPAKTAIRQPKVPAKDEERQLTEANTRLTAAADAVARGEKVSPEILAEYPKLAELAKAKEAFASRDQPVVAEPPASEKPPMLRQGGPGKGITVETARAAIAPHVAKAKVKVDVVQTVAEASKLAGADLAPDTKGFFHEGRVVLVSDNVTDELDAEKTVARHEFVHAGVEVLYGADSKARGAALRDLQRVNPHLRAKASAWRVQYGREFVKESVAGGMKPEEAARELTLRSMEEALAYHAQDSKPLRGWQRFVAVIQRALRERGFERLANWLEEASDAETQSAIADILRAVEKEPKAPRGEPAKGEKDFKAPVLQPALARTGNEDMGRFDRAMSRIDEMVTMWEKGALKPGMSTHLGETPPALQLLGAPALKLYITGEVVEKILSGKHAHQITPEMMRQVPAQVLEPAMVFRPQDPMQRAHGGFIVATELVDKTDKPIIVPVHVRRAEGRLLVNSIASVYGFEDGIRAFETWANKGDLLYYDKGKTAAPSTTLGQPPDEAGRFVQVVQLGAAANPNLRSDADVVKKWGAMFSRAGFKPEAPAKGAEPENRASWDAPEPSRFDSFVYTMQNKHVDTKRVLNAIRETGKEIADQVDPYLKEELYHGRAAKRVADFVNQELKPLLTDMAARGVEMKEFEKYLHARHAEEANQHIAERNADMPDGGSGMETQAAKKYLATLEPRQTRAFEVLAARVDAIVAGTRETLVSYGLESKETIAGWAEQFENYVPLQREDMGDSPGVGQGFSVRGPASKSRTGSKRNVVDILGNIAMQRERAIVRGEKNRVATALVGLATLNENPDFWKVDDPPVIRSVDKKTNRVTEHVDPLYKSRENVVMARIRNDEGEIIERAVLFNEHDDRALRMAKALKNLDMDQLSGLVGAMGVITRYYASVSTQYNPVFAPFNLTRDVQGAAFNLTTTPIAGKQAEVAKHILPALRGIYIDLRDQRAGKEPRSAWAEIFEDFQQHGAQTAYRDMFVTAADRAKALEREIEKAKKNGGSIPRRAWDATFDWLSDYNSSAENAVRLSVYKVGLDSGLTKERAASIAKGITVNFNRKGQAGAQLGAWYAFANAAIQGTARTYETLTGPKGKAIIGGGVTFGVLQAIALAAAGFDEDEPPEFVREKNIIIPIGGKKYISIPMAQGFLVLPNIGRLATQYVLGGFKKGPNHVIQLMSVLAEAFNPLGNAGLSAQTLSPTPLDPLVALSENKDFAGRPIARKDRSSLHPTPGFTRTRDVASPPSKYIAQAINTLTGGTSFKPGVFSPTGDQIDYLIGQATGGVGREAVKLATSARAMVTGEDLPAHKIPLVSRLYGDAASPSAQGSKFYRNLTELNEHQAELKGRRKNGEPTGDYRKGNPETRLISLGDAAEREVAKLQARKRALVEKEAPREQVKALEDLIARRMSRFNERVDAARKSGK